MFKRFIAYFPILSLLIMLFSSCGQQSTAISPKAIDEEVDVCGACMMMVQDNQYSAQVVKTNGEAFKFDDIGCMAMYIIDNQPGGQPFVRDFYTSEWLKVEDAFFVLTDEVETPMNYGFLAFTNKSDRDQFLAESKGEEISWNEVIEIMKERGSHHENELSYH
ncbi:nitrous oxide reductase accessory protein NosL [Calidifontibacillus erzurumensis]|uniref:nitrous oxide reductase accessory protein NosL n=1 Tax=Calidifontibacillus erzurumensis TaxID=2741433 RepID=UPI0035B51FAB